MGYILQALITKKAAHHQFTASYKHAVAVNLVQDLILIPFTGELFDEINKLSQSKPIGKFCYLTENIELELLKHFEKEKVAYIEADYFGAKGTQIAIIWEDKRRIYLSEPGNNEINKVLKDFGLIADSGKDEFDTALLGRYRETESWLDNNI